MNTPIIDALWGQCKGIREYHAALEETAKKLEADRASLLDALGLYGLSYSDDEIRMLAESKSGMGEIGPVEARREFIRRHVIAKAKANFPTP